MPASGIRHHHMSAQPILGIKSTGRPSQQRPKDHYLPYAQHFIHAHIAHKPVTHLFDFSHHALNGKRSPLGPTKLLCSSAEQLISFCFGCLCLAFPSKRPASMELILKVLKIFKHYCCVKTDMISHILAPIAEYVGQPSPAQSICLL